MSVIGYLLNILIVVLLAVTIGYCWILNRRIKILQDSKGELGLLLNHFDESTQRASDSIIALQTASKKIGETIQSRIDKANYLVDDLSLMIERGNKLANQIEASFAVSRAKSRAINEQPAPEIHEPEAPPAPRPAPPVLQNFDEERVAVNAPDKSSAFRQKTVASLEAVLDRVAGHNRKNTPEAKSDAAQKARSRAEQELLEMLKVGIKG